jgi:hypothetical protein
MRRRIPAAGVS